MVVIKHAKRNRSGNKDKFEDDEFIKFLKSFGFEFDNEGRLINKPFTENRRSEDEKR
ncbi:Uncharacterised protein [[Clostridium] sordellii]|uniref:hypothetical protein n=1 Tax=Paraclostridium sordellii TaxID=1505 RepID=UPI0005DB7213|nr:hypothetical protein [Paeniclostridium sordellii]CEN25154.1 Uncharacterised protein [[Clostridium] sordellii] [Paeniclostridium sordellii]